MHPWHVGSSWTRARTHVPCIGKQILNHCATREAPNLFSLIRLCQVKRQLTTNLFSVSMDLPALDKSSKCNHILCGLWGLASFTQHNVFEVHPCCSIVITSYLFMAEQYSIVSTDHILLIYSPTDGRLVLFHFFTIVNSAAMNIYVRV